MTAKLSEQFDCGDHCGGTGGKTDAERIDDLIAPVRARETTMFFVLILFFHNGFLDSKTGRSYAAGVLDTPENAPRSSGGRTAAEYSRFTSTESAAGHRVRRGG